MSHDGDPAMGGMGPYYGNENPHKKAALPSILPSDPKVRKTIPVATGFDDYFPRAKCAVARVSYDGNQQHNPGQPLHWDRSKSTDQEDTIGRHSLERGTFDVDGNRHSAKRAWRALAALELEIEADGGRLFESDVR